MSKKWLNGSAPVRTKPQANAAQVLVIPERSVVETTGELLNQYEQITYRSADATITGWVYSGWLEYYFENYAKDCVQIPDQTPDPRDAEQYFMWRGIKQTNICGEASAAYILKLPLQQILTTWQREKPTIWKSVFGAGKLRGTGYGELISIFEVFQCEAIGLTAKLYDGVIGRARYTPAALQAACALGGVIAGVNIDYAGRLKPNGTPHWVVVTDVQPERAGYGLVTLYNPFPNRIEVYSWDEFLASAKVPTGVFVPAKS